MEGAKERRGQDRVYLLHAGNNEPVIFFMQPRDWGGTRRWRWVVHHVSGVHSRAISSAGAMPLRTSRQDATSPAPGLFLRRQLCGLRLNVEADLICSSTLTIAVLQQAFYARRRLCRSKPIGSGKFCPRLGSPNERLHHHIIRQQRFDLPLHRHLEGGRGGHARGGSASSRRCRRIVKRA